LNNNRKKYSNDKEDKEEKEPKRRSNQLKVSIRFLLAINRVSDIMVCEIERNSDNYKARY